MITVTMMMMEKTVNTHANANGIDRCLITKFQQLDWRELMKWKWYGWNSFSFKWNREKNDSQNTIRFCTLSLAFALHSIFFFICNRFNTQFFFYTIFPLAFPLFQQCTHLSLRSFFLEWMSSPLFHPWKCKIRFCHEQQEEQMYTLQSNGTHNNAEAHYSVKPGERIWMEKVLFFTIDSHWHESYICDKTFVYRKNPIDFLVLASLLLLLLFAWFKVKKCTLLQLDTDLSFFPLMPCKEKHPFLSFNTIAMHRHNNSMWTIKVFTYKEFQCNPNKSKQAGRQALRSCVPYIEHNSICNSKENWMWAFRSYSIH